MEEEVAVGWGPGHQVLSPAQHLFLVLLIAAL